MSKSQVFLLLCLSFVFGVFVQSVLILPWLLQPGFFVSGVIMAAIGWGQPLDSAPSTEFGTSRGRPLDSTRGRQKFVVAGFCLMLAAFGAWRFNAASSVADNGLSQFNEKGRVALVGTVSEEPDERLANTQYKIAPNEYGISGRRYKGGGNLLVVSQKYPAYNYGDQIEITGFLKTPSVSEEFDYKKYLAKNDVYSLVYYPQMKLLAAGQGNWFLARLFWIKNKLTEATALIFSEPQASFLGGLLFGEKSGLPADLATAFKLTGTSHIIALSGYNITIIAETLMAFLGFFYLRRGISFWICAAIIFSFVLMTGAAASAVRAAVMGILLLIAAQSGRLYNIRNALIFAGVLMIYANPKILTFDLGFQLSFGATLGLIYVAPLLQNKFGLKSPEGLPQKSFLGWREILFASLAAQLAVLPLLLINFGQLSLIAPLSNLLILFFIPYTMFFGFITSVAGVLWLELGRIFMWPAWLLLTYEIKTIEVLAKIPSAAIDWKWNWAWGAFYYVLLVGVVWHLRQKATEYESITNIRN